MCKARILNNRIPSTSLVVQWLRYLISVAGDTSSIPGPGTKILPAAHGGKKKQKTGFAREGSLGLVDANYYIYNE